MIVDGVLILYTSNPNCAQMRAWAERLGIEVFFKPLAQLKLKRKVAISLELAKTLPQVQPN